MRSSQKWGFIIWLLAVIVALIIWWGPAKEGASDFIYSVFMA